jgi:hypothetical protein
MTTNLDAINAFKDARKDPKLKEFWEKKDEEWDELMRSFHSRDSGELRLTTHQIDRVTAIDVGGKGGKEKQIAEALGHTIQSSGLWDAVTKDGKRVEYKKQQGSQFLDPYKFSKMTEDEKKIPLLFFIHDGSFIKEIHLTDYATLIKTMGYTSADLKAIKKLYDRKCFRNRPNTQIKAELKRDEIRTFKKIY